ncbi:MAG TPA: hypothetical protein VG101_15820 [Puia sp.]|jgi:hypothetical protein|nr:hypothetical protein [Puia sp.]
MMLVARKYWYIFFPAMALLWVLFKCCYPYADFFTDSYTYIQAAADHDAISYRPIGYSLFLRLMHWICRSDTFLVTIQFLLVQSACWLLFVFICRRCTPSTWVQVLIATFLLLDPLVYYISNFVSSDALFIALSLFWLVSLMQLTDAPTWRGLVIQWILLLMIFYTRYVALFYPIVAVISYCWLHRGWRFRLAAMAGSVMIVAAGVGYTRELTWSETGAPVFSAFSGWQIANNALNLYPRLPVDTAGLPPETQSLAGYVNRYFNREGAALPQDPPGATTAYMWEKKSPLHAYLDDYRRANSGLRQRTDSARLPYFIAWNRVAPVFSRYGYFLLQRHPVAFARYYLWPSAGSFFFSPLDVLSTYLDGKKEIDPVAREWFGYGSGKLRVCSATLQGKICAPFPWLSLMLNLAFVLMTVSFIIRRDLRDQYPAFTSFLRVAAVYLGVNFCFNVFASASVYRYQILPLILLFIFTACGTFFVTYRKQPSHV